MLRVIQNTNSSRAKSYFSTADYYSEGQELIGHWRGKGAVRLGLDGIIGQKDWGQLCDNRRPDTGCSLTLRRKSTRRVGYDFNFHAPKSLSVLFGITQDARILEVFSASVNDTMHDIESEAKARVRRGGKNEDRVTGNLLWGEFVHFTARPVDGVPDPHLHAHCFVFNATFDPHEDRWKAAQFGDLKRDAPYFEAVFHTRLARGLEEIGLETVRTSTGWELTGIMPESIERFSRRTKQIEQIANERGITDPKQKDELGAISRSGKAKELTMSELRNLWANQLSHSELKAIATTLGNVGYRSIPEDRTIAVESVRRAMDHCFERKSVLPERTLLTEALRQGVGKASRKIIEKQAKRTPLVRVNRDNRPMVTTHEVLAEESEMLAFARNGRGTCHPFSTRHHQFHREWLNEQQKSAVRYVLESRDRVMLIRGAAGVGKTTMMQEAREAIEQAGTRVFAFAPSADASRGVLREAGFSTADTVARLLLDERIQNEIRGGLIWIDEAGQIGTKTMRQVFELAKKMKARVVLSGDRRQHGSVERGAALRMLETEAGIQPVEIKNIQRQRNQYKAAIKALSEERTKQGFTELDQLGWIREISDDIRYQALAEEYVRALQMGKTALVVSPTHAEGDRITSEIRRKLKESHSISGKSHTLPQLVPTHFTLGQREDPANYVSGDVIVFHQNAKGYRKGTRLVAGRDPIPFDQAERFTVFRHSQIELSRGDRIRISRNGSTLDELHSLNNGDIFTIEGFTPDDDIVLNSGWIVAADYAHLSYGFTVTSHASQGRTVDRVLIGQSSDSFPASSREQFYVSASRGREQVLVFTDNKKELLEAIDHSDERLSGTQLVAGRDQDHQRVVRERLVDQSHNLNPLGYTSIQNLERNPNDRQYD